MSNDYEKNILLFILLTFFLFAEDKKVANKFNSSQDLYEEILKTVKVFEGDFLSEISKEDFVIVKKWPEELQRKLATYNQSQKLKIYEFSQIKYSQEDFKKTETLFEKDMKDEDKKMMNVILPSQKVFFIVPKIQYYKYQNFLSNKEFKEKQQKLEEEENTKEHEKIGDNSISGEELELLTKCRDSIYDNNVSRDETRKLLFSYIKKYPDSKLLPSIYFRIGYTYLGGRNIKKKEIANPILAYKHYGIATKLYNKKYSKYLRMAWSAIVDQNDSDSNINNRLEYLRFLYKLRDKGTINDFYPYREFPAVVYVPIRKFTNDILNDIVYRFKNEYNAVINAGEVNVLWRTKEKAELELLIKEFPDKEIAKKAQEKLRKLFPETKVQEVVKVTNNEQIPEKENIVKNIGKSQKGKVFLILGFLLIIGLFIFMRIKRKKISK